MVRSFSPPPALRAYLAATQLLGPLAKPVLRRRLARGKEDPSRWREKLGVSDGTRPDGRLVWLHAVGLGEVQALRGLIARLSSRAPDLSFLVTSTGRASGEVFTRTLPPRTQHRYLPLDLPRPICRFLDTWRPDLAVWAEQDFWPGLATETIRRGIPMAMVNARMDSVSFRKRARFKALYAPLLARMTYVSAQDSDSGRHLHTLGTTVPVDITGPLKAAAPALAADSGTLTALAAAVSGRTIWVLASSHPEDEDLALAAEAMHGQDSLLLIAPRDPGRGAEIRDKAGALGLSSQCMSMTALPDQDCRVFVGDAFGVLGLFYRVAPISLIGGTFGDTEGHNPWEAVRLGSAVLHGPRVANFKTDFAVLSKGGARQVRTSQDIVEARAENLSGQVRCATEIADDLAQATDRMADRLITLLPDGST